MTMTMKNRTVGIVRDESRLKLVNESLGTNGDTIRHTK